MQHTTMSTHDENSNEDMFYGNIPGGGGGGEVPNLLTAQHLSGMAAGSGMAYQEPAPLLWPPTGPPPIAQLLGAQYLQASPQQQQQHQQHYNEYMFNMHAQAFATPTGQPETYSVLPVGHGNFLKVYHCTENGNNESVGYYQQQPPSQQQQQQFHLPQTQPPPPSAQIFNNYELFSNNTFIPTNDNQIFVTEEQQQQQQSPQQAPILLFGPPNAAHENATQEITQNNNNNSNNSCSTNMIINKLVNNWSPNLTGGTYLQFGAPPPIPVNAEMVYTQSAQLVGGGGVAGGVCSGIAAEQQQNNQQQQQQLSSSQTHLSQSSPASILNNAEIQTQLNATSLQQQQKQSTNSASHLSMQQLNIDKTSSVLGPQQKPQYQHHSSSSSNNNDQPIKGTTIAPLTTLSSSVGVGIGIAAPEVKKRIVAEVKPMPMTYSDVVLSKFNSQHSKNEPTHATNARHGSNKGDKNRRQKHTSSSNNNNNNNSAEPQTRRQLGAGGEDRNMSSRGAKKSSPPTENNKENVQQSAAAKSNNNAKSSSKLASGQQPNLNSSSATPTQTKQQQQQKQQSQQKQKQNTNEKKRVNNNNNNNNNNCNKQTAENDDERRELENNNKNQRKYSPTNSSLRYNAEDEDEGKDYNIFYNVTSAHRTDSGDRVERVAKGTTSNHSANNASSLATSSAGGSSSSRKSNSKSSGYFSNSNGANSGNQSRTRYNNNNSNIASNSSSYSYYSKRNRGSNYSSYSSSSSMSLTSNRNYELAKKFLHAWWTYTLKVLNWLFYLVYDIVVLGCSMVYERLTHAYICGWAYARQLHKELKQNSNKPGIWLKKYWRRFDERFKKDSRWAFWRRFYKKKSTESSQETFKSGRLPQTGEEAMYSLLNCKGKDAYSILGVPPDCSQEQIRKHYKKIAVLVHPDKNKLAGAEEAFKVLQRAFELIEEPENRLLYDQTIAETLHAEKAWTELHDLLSQLQTKMTEAANTIRCSTCGLRHPRKLTDRPHYAARECASCKIRHSAREGDIWAETFLLGFRWKYLALMEGKVYDITEWANCQKGALSHLEPNSHVVQYRIVRGAQQQQQQQQQQHQQQQHQQQQQTHQQHSPQHGQHQQYTGGGASGGAKYRRDMPTSEASLHEFLDNLYSGQHPNASNASMFSGGTSRRRSRRN